MKLFIRRAVHYYAYSSKKRSAANLQIYIPEQVLDVPIFSSSLPEF